MFSEKDFRWGCVCKILPHIFPARENYRKINHRETDDYFNVLCDKMTESDLGQVTELTQDNKEMSLSGRTEKISSRLYLFWKSF